jgi:glutaryl-CoA dehydrogenase (non-decarboxylating)
MGTSVIPPEWAAASDLVELVRHLGQRSLATELDEIFADHRFAEGATEAMVEAGLFGLTLPARYGGQGRNYTALAAVCEELGRIDTSFQVALTVHLGLVSMCILQWGDEAQRERWLPRLARGERLATFGLTEPGAGSDVGALRMRAREVDGGYLLNGEKSWISSANISNLFLLFATVDPTKRHRGITAFIVPGETPGLMTTKLHGKLGVRAGDTGTVVCNDVFVPRENVLGEVGEGFAVALSALGNGLFTVGCGALGIAATCRSWTADYLRAVGDPGTGWEAGELAGMVAREEASRLLLARAAALKNAGLPNARETGLAKWTAAEAGYANANAALLIFNAHEAGENLTLLRHWANAKGAVIYGGTSEIHQTMQAAYALGDRTERPSRIPNLSAADLA